MMLALNQSLPEWSIQSIDQEHTPTIADFHGKPMLILIFSLGCPGCIGRAIPFANRIVYEYGDQISVIGLHTNFERNPFTKEQFQKAKEDYFIRFPFYKDSEENETFYHYGAGGTPHWILIDENGIVIYSIFGSDPNNALLRLDLKLEELFQKE